MGRLEIEDDVIDYAGFAFAKSHKHAAKLALAERRKKTKAREEAQKALARKRDGNRCRWPHATAEERRACKALPLEVAHWKAKAMGGDHGLRSTTENLITFDRLVHQGPTFSLHNGTLKVEPLTPDKMNGPCAFYARMKRGGRWVEVGREISVGVLGRRSK